MKTAIVITFLAALTGVSHASATDPNQPASASAASAKSGQDAILAGMMENMRKMQRQMEKIQATTDPKERQKLMQEHMQAMRDNMRAMRAMGGSTTVDERQGKAGGPMTRCHDMTEKRMGMMQMMMDQMMQHQSAEGPAPAVK